MTLCIRSKITLVDILTILSRFASKVSYFLKICVFVYMHAGIVMEHNFLTKRYIQIS